MTTPPILPPQTNTIVYYEGVNVGLIFVSPNPLDGDYVQQQISVPQFNSSIGTLQTTSLTIKDASSGMIWAPYASYPYFAWAYADGYINVGDGGVPTASNVDGGPDPYWNTRVDDGTLRFAGPVPQLEAVAEVGFCAGGPIVTICMADLVGFVQVKYTYT